MSLLPGWSFRYRLWVAYCGVKLISWLRIDDYCNVCCLFYFYLFGFSSHIFTRFLKGILEELSSCRFSSQSKINKCFFFIFGLICHFCDGNRNIVSDILGEFDQNKFVVFVISPLILHIAQISGTKLQIFKDVLLVLHQNSVNEK